jgi:hypothetical protein
MQIKEFGFKNNLQAGPFIEAKTVYRHGESVK